ncbi:hypothetical protein BT69DRAFT_708433 [Atractiella rhizophila]|nr:hypothetical protein BT69DRAFT_708433 [Atractiella rhizophila]
MLREGQKRMRAKQAAQTSTTAVPASTSGATQQTTALPNFIPTAPATKNELAAKAASPLKNSDTSKGPPKPVEKVLVFAFPPSKDLFVLPSEFRLVELDEHGNVVVEESTAEEVEWTGDGNSKKRKRGEEELEKSSAVEGDLKSEGHKEPKGTESKKDVSEEGGATEGSLLGKPSAETAMAASTNVSKKVDSMDVDPPSMSDERASRGVNTERGEEGVQVGENQTKKEEGHENPNGQPDSPASKEEASKDKPVSEVPATVENREDREPSPSSLTENGAPPPGLTRLRKCRLSFYIPPPGYKEKRRYISLSGLSDPSQPSMTDATPDPMVPVDMMLTSVPENVWREMKKLEGKIDKDERDKKYAVQKSVQPPPKYLHLLAPKNAPAKSYMPVAPSAPTSQAQAARPSAPPVKRARMNPPVRGRVVISGRGGTSGAGAGRGAPLTRTDSSSFKGAQSQIMAGSPLKGAQPQIAVGSSNASSSSYRPTYAATGNVGAGRGSVAATGRGGAPTPARTVSGAASGTGRVPFSSSQQYRTAPISTPPNPAPSSRDNAGVVDSTESDSNSASTSILGYLLPVSHSNI